MWNIILRLSSTIKTVIWLFYMYNYFYIRFFITKKLVQISSRVDKMKANRIAPKPEIKLNLVVNECWKCKNDYIVPYVSTDVSIPFGPSNFTEKQLDLSKKYGCNIKESFSETMQESYLAAVCPICGAMFGDFFYHDFSYQEGNVVIKLDDNDDVTDIKINSELKLREQKVYIESEFTRKNKDDNKNRENVKLNEMIQTRLSKSPGLCVRVRFDDNRNYLYNVRFPVSIGDKVKVTGKKSGLVGTVIGISSSWKIDKYMQQIVEVFNS